MTADLFSDLLDLTEFAYTDEEQAACAARHEDAKKAKAIAVKTSRLAIRRAKSEAVLAEILPAELESGMSYHDISHGDVDALSYLIHIVRQRPIATLTISTWCMAMPDVKWIGDQLRAGRIGHVHFCLGEIFPGQYGDEYEAIVAIERAGLCKLSIARNHSKIMVAADPETGFYVAIEKSANVNTNPRIEQTAIHVSRELHDFYADFFAGIKDIDARRHTVAVDGKN